MRVLVISAALWMATSSAIWAQSDENGGGLPASCEVVDSSAMISVLVCDGELSEEELAEAGQAACDTRIPCGAWIWPDAASAPDTAPDNHDGLNEASVTSAMGVWVAEQELFISIEAVK